MKLFLIILIVLCHIISQTSVDARARHLKKLNWPYVSSGYYKDYALSRDVDQKRQAGWGKRRYITVDDINDDLLFHHLYAPHEESTHDWPDDQ